MHSFRVKNVLRNEIPKSMNWCISSIQNSRRKLDEIKDCIIGAQCGLINVSGYVTMGTHVTGNQRIYHFNEIRTLK